MEVRRFWLYWMAAVVAAKIRKVGHKRLMLSVKQTKRKSFSSFLLKTLWSHHQFVVPHFCSIWTMAWFGWFGPPQSVCIELSLLCLRGRLQRIPFEVLTISRQAVIHVVDWNVPREQPLELLVGTIVQYGTNPRDEETDDYIMVSHDRRSYDRSYRETSAACPKDHLRCWRRRRVRTRIGKYPVLLPQELHHW